MTNTRGQRRPAGEGLGVDVRGGPVIDPTENVLSLVAAANTRQDDLRAETNRRYDAEIRHLREMALLRAQHNERIGELESSRLNAIRQVDVLAVSTAADRAQAAIRVLEQTTNINAEKLQGALNATATTIANQLTTLVTQITERIAALEKSAYEGAGKERYADPQLASLSAQVRALTESRAAGSGKSAGLNAGWIYLLGAIAAMGGLFGMLATAVSLYLALARR